MQISENTRHIVIFGDAYSSPSPTRTKWPDYFKFHDEYPSPVVHNFATADWTFSSIHKQLLQFFDEFPDKGKKPPLLPPDKTLYVIFMGTHEIQYQEREPQHMAEHIRDALSWLERKAQMKMFLIINIPPVYRAPGNWEIEQSLWNKIKKHNRSLYEEVCRFTKESKSACTGFFYSSYRHINRMLDHPFEYNFEYYEVGDNRLLWNDKMDMRIDGQEHQHFTSRIHKLAAEGLVSSMIDHQFIWYKSRPKFQLTDDEILELARSLDNIPELSSVR